MHILLQSAARTKRAAALWGCLGLDLSWPQHRSPQSLMGGSFAPDAISLPGLVPRQYTTGGKAKLGGIGRRANDYLRRQIVHGARAVMSQAGRRSDPQSEWMKGVAARRGFNRAVIAVANKMARAAWAMLVREEKYVPARS